MKRVYVFETGGKLGHSVPCMTILFLTCKSPDPTSGHTPSRLYISLVIACGHFILFQGLV